MSGSERDSGWKEKVPEAPVKIARQFTGGKARSKREPVPEARLKRRLRFSRPSGTGSLLGCALPGLEKAGLLSVVPGGATHASFGRRSGAGVPHVSPVLRDMGGTQGYTPHVICPRCHLEFQSETGKCPHCRHDSPAHLTKRQKENPDESEMSGPFRLYSMTCEKCGKEVPVTVTRFSGEAAKRLGEEWVIPQDHECMKEAS